MLCVPQINGWQLAGYIPTAAPIITDGELLRIPADGDVSGQIKRQVQRNLQRRHNPHFAEIEGVADYCRQKANEAAERTMAHDGGAKQVKVWSAQEVRARELLTAWARSTTVPEDLLHDTMRRYLLLMIDAKTITDGRHNIDGVTIVGGIIQATAGARR